MDSISNSVNDPLNLVEKIVFEVKSQGLFDRFRKECISDVDTKPAYQNLRQRVESSVTNFLKDQKWSAELNKNHLRDKLRKQVTESGFLETGVERIVDQVVNPKISTTFLPQVEDIVCKFLGIDKLPYKVAPTFKFSPSVELKIETDLLPTDLEAVSPDSEKNSESNFEIKQSPNSNADQNDSVNDKIEEFESPPFEPLCPAEKVPKEESNDSNMSVISGLTSQDSVPSEKEIIDIQQSNFENVEEKPTNMLLEPQDNLNLITRVSPDSQLSQVSSDSRLSILTHSNSSKSGIIEADQPENTNGVSELTIVNKLPENSPHNFIDIKNEFEKTIIKDNVVEKHIENVSSVNDESMFNVQEIKVAHMEIVTKKEELVDEYIPCMKEETTESIVNSCDNTESMIITPEETIPEEISPQTLPVVKMESPAMSESIPDRVHEERPNPISVFEPPNPEEIKPISTIEPSSEEAKRISPKDVVISSECSTESPKFYQEGSSDSVSDTMAKQDDSNSNSKDQKISKSDSRSKGSDDTRKNDSKGSSSSSRYSKSYSNDRDKDKNRSRDRDRSRDRKYSSIKSSRDRTERDLKYDHCRSRTNTPDKSKSSASSSRSSSKKYTSSSDKLNDKKKYKSDDHSSSRNKNHDKRRSTDHDSNDGSNDGCSNSRSNSSSNQQGGSSQSNACSNSTNTNNNPSSESKHNDRDRDRDHKKEVNSSSSRSKNESFSSRDYDSKYSSNSSSKRRSYNSSSYSSSSKSKKSRSSREEDLLYFPDKNCYYRSKNDKFLQFASNLRSECKSYKSSIFLLDANSEFVDLLSNKRHQSIVNYQNDETILPAANKLKKSNKGKRSIHQVKPEPEGLNKKLFRENNQVNLNLLEHNINMKLNDIITMETDRVLHLNSDTVADGVTGETQNKTVLPHANTNAANAKLTQHNMTPNEGSGNVNSSSVVKSTKPKISQKSSQTYSNEDLYKPRNIFGQRSRRRGLNNDDIF